MIVDLYDLTDDGYKKVGDVTFENGCLTATGQGADLIKEPLRCHDQTGRYDIDPQQEPERFMRALPQVYSGSYFRAVTRCSSAVKRRTATMTNQDNNSPTDAEYEELRAQVEFQDLMDSPERLEELRLRLGAKNLTPDQVQEEASRLASQSSSTDD
jgi:hypothetical protein